MLQEIKVDGFRLLAALDTILPQYHQIIYAFNEGRGGVALIIHPDFKIIQDGSIPGAMAWAQIEGPLGSLYVGLVYGVISPSGHTNIWRTLNNSLPNGSWVIAGNFNFTEEPRDSSSQASLL